MLPGQKITFLIVPENTSKVKQIKCSRAFLGVVLSLVVALVVGGGVLFRDYLKVKAKIPAMEALAREVTSQRVQIQAYAKRIGSLNNRMSALHDFEQKIRIIANMEAPAGQEGVFGIGGISSETLEELPELTEKHNQVMRTMHAQLEQLDEAAFVQERAFEQLHDEMQHQKSLLACTPAVKPTKGWLSSRFGYRKSPFTGLREFHSGLDLATRRGTPVIASADGVVAFTGRNGGMGKMIKINHGYGKVTRYAHLHEILVKRGDRVKRGDQIGLVGNTGRSTAPHLHYEVHVNGIPVNPEKYILN